MRLSSCRAALAAVVGLFALGAAACGASSTSADTSALDAALDGPWTTARASLTLAFNLTWSAGKITGTGSYATFAGEAGCTGQNLAQFGAVTFTGTLQSPSAVSGTLAFDSGWKTSYSGTLDPTGIARIEGTMVQPDGSACELELIHALVP